MKIILFGASGMVGQGVLRECLQATDVDRVLAVVRHPLGTHTDARVHELVRDDLADLAPVAAELTGYDACFFCLGVSSAGMSEADYTRVTYELTLAAARLLVERNPTMVFIYVSGDGTDSSERGRSMWARVKGRTENALVALPFRAAYMFRPAFIRPMYGVVSKTRLYRVLYVVAWPFYPLLRLVIPGRMTTSENVGRAMLEAARHGAPGPILDSRAINALAQRA